MAAAAGFEIGPDQTAMLSGDMTFATVKALSLHGETMLAGAPSIRKIDLQRVEQVDSSGLALLLEWQSMAHSRGSSIAILNAPDDLARLARLCEAEELLQMNHQEPVGTSS